MSFGGLILTNAGRNKIAAAMSEKTALQFTHIQLGDGAYNGSYTSKTELSNMVMEIPVTRIVRDGNEVTIDCDWDSKQAPSAFYLREIGIIGNGVLCYYDNARSGDAEYVDPNSEDVVKQKRFRFTVSITDDANVTTMITSGLYALQKDVDEQLEAVNEEVGKKVDRVAGKGLSTEDYTTEDKNKLDEHVGNTNNPHAVTKAQVGLSEVPNVKTNDQTPTFSQAGTRENIKSGEKLSAILGKIMKWFTDLKTVAFTGSYNDLTNRPTIPTSLPANGGNADTVDGFHASLTPDAASTCVVRNAYGYTDLGYINSNTRNNENPTISQLIVTNGSDNYFRKASLQHLKNSLGLGTYTLGKSVPSDAIFTDTNTWRGIQDNLSSHSTVDSLTANQGRVLSETIDNMLSYREIGMYIQPNTSALVIRKACCENGTVFICFDIQGGYSGNNMLFRIIDNHYIPFYHIYGSFGLSTQNDVGKVCSSYINNSGECRIWVNGTLDNIVHFSFVYPAKDL